MSSVTFKRNTKQFAEMVGEQWKSTTVVGKVTVFPAALVGLFFLLLISYITVILNWCSTTGSMSVRKVFYKDKG